MGLTGGTGTTTITMDSTASLMIGQTGWTTTWTGHPAAQMALMVWMETGPIWWVDGMASGGWQGVVAAVGLWLVVPTGVAEQCTVNKERMARCS